MARVTLENVSIRHGAFALSDINLVLEEGSITALLGASGSGKATLLRTIAGFIKPTSGRVLLGDACVADAHHSQPVHTRNIGLMFQNYALFPHLTVLENVAFGLPRRERKRAVEWLERLHIAHLAGRYPHAISGGEQQRTALARALAPHPAVMLLDEPFANLDADLRAGIRAECLHTLTQEGMTTLLVTYDKTEAESFASRCLRIENGRLAKIT